MGEMRYFVHPAGSGTPLIQEFVLRTFGTANWTQFCPGMIIETRLRQSYGAAGRDYRRREIEFFCGLKCT